MGCGDTGIDVDSCFFWDSNPANGRPGPTFAPILSSTHRKIVSYKAGGGTGTGDASDGVRGHGTHVVGSIVGSVDSSFTTGDDVSEHAGMAPAAKIAFFDLDDAGKGLDIPDDLVEDYYEWAYQAGARIHTNSWGDDSNEYTLITAETDEFVFKNQDMLVLFAAGNDGDSNPPDHTVGAPATCKNCLTIGASQGDERDALKDGGRLEVYVEAEGGTPEMTGSYMATSASFGPKIESTPGEVSLLSFVGDACGPLNVTLADLNLIAVVQRGTCNFVDKIRHAQQAGAMAVIVTNNVVGDPISLGGEDSGDVTIPSVMISKEDGEAMYNLTRDAPGKKVSVELSIAHSLPSFNQNNLAAFSSLGPTSDGRLKPDLVAPGQDIHSAFSDGMPYSYQCDQDGKSSTAALTKMSGTSMATPIAAGAAALARQYFRTGKYRDVSSGAGSWMIQPNAAAFLPSAALLRAVLINGAQDMSQMAGRRGSKGAPLLAAPSMEIGYGRLNLAKSLHVPASTASSNAVSPSLIVLDGAAQSTALPSTRTELAVVAHGQVRRHCFKVGPKVGASTLGTPLKITLAWTDPPAEPNSAVALVHNLDLALFHDNTLIYGNHHLLRPAGAVGEDEEDVTDVLNPTEQVVVTTPDTNSVYVIYVMGTKVVRSRTKAESGSGEGGGDVGAGSAGANIEGTQDYALAITGENLEALSQDSPDCLAVSCPGSTTSGTTNHECSGHGQCVDGKCMCTTAYWGADCALRKSCPRGEAGDVCSGHGTCDLENAMCICEQGWSGPACQIFSCLSGQVTNVTVMPGQDFVIKSCSDGSTYNPLLACAWQLESTDGVGTQGGGGLYLMASLERLEIESNGNWAFPMFPGCLGEQHCTSECIFDALHVVRGLLEPFVGGAVTSDETGQPCHEWAMSQSGYLGAYCGSAEDLNDGEMGEMIQLPHVARGEAISLIFCSDAAVQPGSGFSLRVSAVPCPHNCTGHGACPTTTRAFTSDPTCVCSEGWTGVFCQIRAVHCDPNANVGVVKMGGELQNTSEAAEAGAYVCVSMCVCVYVCVCVCVCMCVCRG